MAIRRSEPMKKMMALMAIACCVACSDDAGKTDQDGGNADTGTDTATEDMSGGGDNSTPDMARQQPDLGDDMTTAPDMAGDTGGDMAADMGADMGPELPPLEIDWPDDPELFANTANATYIPTLSLPPLSDGKPTCCYDFGAKSKNEGIDNAFAILASTLQGFDFDLNAVLLDSLMTGALTVLLDHRELDGPDDADGFVLSWLRGEFEGTTDYPDAAAGNGTFLLDPDSLDATGAPLLYFDPALMEGGSMSAGPDQLSLILPFIGLNLEVTVEEATMTGDAMIGSPEVSYDSGTMSGYVTVEEIFTGINEIVASECSCLGLGATPLYEQDGDGDWTGNCVSDPELVCPDIELCRTLGGDDINSSETCSATLTFLPQLADIDTDGDTSKYEAVSLGMEWTGVPATVVGVSQ
jgi:hypothetical protein